MMTDMIEELFEFLMMLAGSILVLVLTGAL